MTQWPQNRWKAGSQITTTAADENQRAKTAGGGATASVQKPFDVGENPSVVAERVRDFTAAIARWANSRLLRQIPRFYLPGDPSERLQLFSVRDFCHSFQF